MLKNKTWIVALLAAFTMAFIGFGCTDAGLDFSPPEPEKGEYENIELGAVGFKGGQAANQQGWYSIGYQDSDLLGTPVATVEQFRTAKYLVVRLKSVPNSISGETAAVQVIWGGDGAGWQSGSNITVSTADDAAIRYDAEAKELWVELSKALSMYSDYAALKTGARLVLQSWSYSAEEAYDTAYLVVPTDPSTGGPAPVVVPTTYIIPKSGGTFFYLNLNDYQTEGAVNAHVPDGELTKTSLTLFFTENDQRANFKLTDEQVKALKDRNTDYPVTATVVGYASALGGEIGDSTTPFRYHLGNAKVGSDWNATTAAANTAGVQGAFSSLTGEADFAFTAALTADWSKITDELLGYFILQQRAGAETEVVIRSIKIGYMPSLDPVEVEAAANEAFPEGIEGANGPEFTDGDGQKWLVMAPATLDYDGEGGQDYASEIRTVFSDLSEFYSVYDKVKLTVVARELTTAEATTAGYTVSGTGSLEMTVKVRTGEYGQGSDAGYPGWGSGSGQAAKGAEQELEYAMTTFATGGAWDGFIIPFNGYQWNTNGNDRVAPFLVRITKIEFYFDD